MTKLVINSLNRQVTINFSDTALNCETQSKKKIILNNVKLKNFEQRNLVFMCPDCYSSNFVC